MEEDRNYHQKIELSCTLDKVFKAITVQIDEWWSTLEGFSANVGDEFKVSFGVESYWRFKVMEINEPNVIVWQCIESHQDYNLKGIDDEWINTKLYWSFKEIGDKIVIEFIHEGLIASSVCYEVCSNGWDFCILDSLKSYLEKGEGKPSTK